MTKFYDLLHPMAEVDATLGGEGMPHELETRVVDGQVLKVYKNLPDSIRAFFLSYTGLHGSAPSLVGDGYRFTYQELRSIVVRTAAVLHDNYHIEKGDRVAIVSRNHALFVVTFWALHVLGALPTLVNSYLPISGIKHCIVKTSCKLILVDTYLAKIIASSASSVCKETGARGIIFFPEQPHGSEARSGMKNLCTLLSQYGGDESKILTHDPQTHPDDNGIILFTSGTTGVPKGVLLSQRAFLSAICNASFPSLRAAAREGIPLRSDEGPSKGYLVATPLFHVTAVTTIIVAFASKLKVVLMPKWSTDEAYNLTKAENIVAMAAVPSLVVDILGSKLKDHAFDVLSVGGAPPASTLVSQVKKELPSTLICQMYGLTETMATVCGIAGKDFLERPTSAGVPCAPNEIKIMSPQGVALAPMQVGEIWIRGPTNFKGYWGDPEATAKVLTRDGWFKSGDAGYIDEAGFIYIKDRIKDIIIRGGENVDSTAVENALYEVDDRLMETAAVGVPDKRLGELVTAVVYPKAPFIGRVSEKELIKRVNALLPQYAVPVMVVVVNTPFERNAAGKIVKPALRALAAKEWAKRSKQKYAKL